MGIVIKVENLSKQYRLGNIGTGTIKNDLKAWWAQARGKENPFLKVGDINDRASIGSSEYVWSLRDINFKVEQGDVLGIIGKNGAGKSTLLKILSRVTAPTTGSLSIKGRLASLLEVGTGFHPELTGKENIFLNGAILGMNKKEIRAKLDEIIDFSGVARYVDTPVKRYSSGMYVRLAFAVAAHLESEILIIDEVLAVGDAEFQEKCIGKMQDVAGHGRTVLFVSHNMGSVNQLCKHGILLKDGRIATAGKINDVVDEYLNTNNKSGAIALATENDEKDIFFSEIVLINHLDQPAVEFKHTDLIRFKMHLKFNHWDSKAVVGFDLRDASLRKVFGSNLAFKKLASKPEMDFVVSIPQGLLTPGIYHLDFQIHIPNVAYIDRYEALTSFTIVDGGSDLTQYGKADIGCVFADCTWMYP